MFLNCFPTAVLAKRWDGVQKEAHTTTDGIVEELTPIYNDRGKLVEIQASYTIPEDFKGQNIVIVPKMFDKVAELTNDTGSAMMPGSSVAFSITIQNQSDYDFYYQNNSFVLSTEDLSSYGLTQSGDAISFSGNPIYTIHEPYRTGNSALVSLYQVKNSASLTTEQLSDEELGKKLLEAGYRGIEDLAQYYLDFYNEKYQLTASSLEDFSDDIIKQIFNGNRFVVKETQKELVELSYNWFYNKLFAFTFENDVYQDSTSENFSIGAYMRDPSLGNDDMIAAFEDIPSQNQATIHGLKMHVNGPYTVNTYMLYPFSAYLEFSLTRDVEFGTVICHFVDEEGNQLADDIVTTEEVGKEYSTQAKEIDGYRLKEVNGQEQGAYVAGEIHVTYVYEKDSDSVFEEIPPHTGLDY